MPLGRLARLNRRWRVVMRTGIFGESYRRLLARSHIVFHASNRYKVGPRAFEGAGGALVFQEAGNRELPAYFRDRQECACYRPGEVETLLEHYLEHEEERAALAEAARALAGRCLFEDFWEGILSSIAPEIPAARDRHGDGATLAGSEDWTTRCWQALQSSRFEDEDLVGALERAVGPDPKGEQPADTAARHNALGAMLGRQAQGRGIAQAAEMAGECFRQALAGPVTSWPGGTWPKRSPPPGSSRSTWLLLSQVLLQEGRDWAAAERPTRGPADRSRPRREAAQPRRPAAPPGPASGRMNCGLVN